MEDSPLPALAKSAKTYLDLRRGEASSAASPVEVLGDRELKWDEALALRMAYNLHCSIGCNIEHYRGPTAAGFLAVIRDAYKRTHAPLNKTMSNTAEQK